ncbi:hypothetical protein NVIRPANT_00699 [Pantoea sp. Nvir]|nr:hypothetical protein NVIRPANT_00699 [Pantoea sp. Nvir]
MYLPIYLMIANHNNDAAFERMVNLPARGFGGRTLNMVRQVAHVRQTTLWHESSWHCSTSVN